VWLSQVPDEVIHLGLEGFAQKILFSLNKRDNWIGKQTNPNIVTKAPNFDDIGVNDVDTVFKHLVSEVLAGPKATPISYA